MDVNSFHIFPGQTDQMLVIKTTCAIGAYHH
jgi:hypothetical protein